MLVKDQNIVGLIDFGDISYSNRVNDIAIAIFHIIYDKENYFEFVNSFLEGLSTNIKLNK